MQALTPSILILAAMSGLAGCAPSPVRVDAPASAALRTPGQVRLIGKLRPLPVPAFALRQTMQAGFAPWGLADVGRIVFTVTASGTRITTLERAGALQGDETFELGALKTDQDYTVSLAAYDVLDALISDPEGSRLAIDTHADNAGAYQDALDVTFPLQFADRAFPGRLMAKVNVDVAATSVLVALQRESAGSWLTVQETAIGAAPAGYVRYANLRVGATYRVVATAWQGSAPVVSDATAAFVADPANASATGDLPGVTLELFGQTPI